MCTLKCEHGTARLCGHSRGKLLQEGSNLYACENLHDTMLWALLWELRDHFSAVCGVVLIPHGGLVYQGQEARPKKQHGTKASLPQIDQIHVALNNLTSERCPHCHVN